jgi:hypothetical protein
VWQSGHRPALLISAGPRDHTEYGILGDLFVAISARNYPHRVGTVHLASGPSGGRAIRRSGPTEGPSDGQSIRNVRHSQWPAGPRTDYGPGGTGPGTLRRPGAVAEAGSPPEVEQSPAGHRTRARSGGPGAVTMGRVGHRARARCGGRERWRWFLTRAGTGPSTRVAPPGRGAAGSVTEVTESVDGEAVVQRASTRWPRLAM